MSAVRNEDNAVESIDTAESYITKLKILAVDDDEAIRALLAAALEANDFQVTSAAGVAEALHLIDTEKFDILLCDLHMPGAGDGYTVVSAMRHQNPEAITLVLSGYPALKEAMAAILLQADEVLVKPMGISELVNIIREKSKNRDRRKLNNTERVASILARDTDATIAEWLSRVEVDTELNPLPLSREHRTGHLPKLLAELVHRLRVPRPLGTKQVSPCAVEHGSIRRSQGYTIPMIIEESRIFR